MSKWENDKNVFSREFRNLVIEIVLATDMSTHFVQVKSMKGMLQQPDSIDKVKALCLVVHCSDIAHPAKIWRLHHRWTSLLVEEFFRQVNTKRILNSSTFSTSNSIDTLSIWWVWNDMNALHFIYHFKMLSDKKMSLEKKNEKSPAMFIFHLPILFFLIMCLYDIFSYFFTTSSWHPDIQISILAL